MATKYPFKHLAVTTAEFTWRTDGSSMSSESKEVFVRTAEIIYRKYAPYAAKYAGVRENQQKRLANLKKTHVQKRFVCSIIIPVWNKVELTRQCLVALGPATDDVSFELIVVDNHSTDETPELLASLGGDVRIITNSENLGFAKACNQGAEAATGEYLVFLNNDTIPLKGWLSALVKEVQSDPAVSVVGSKLLYENGTVQHAGVAIDRNNLTPYHIYAGFAGDHPAVNKRRELNAVTGACLLIRRSVFADLGGFDEGFRNGFEDIDLYVRSRAASSTSHGACCITWKVRHPGGNSTIKQTDAVCISVGGTAGGWSMTTASMRETGIEPCWNITMARPRTVSI
jgi:GT2 family glycosyltransferase